MTLKGQTINQQQVHQGDMKVVKSNNEKVLVIGGGLAGLASACTLAARGYKVELFEKNDWLGGKAAILEKEGYRFDMGPTILTIPSVLRRIFAEAGKNEWRSIENGRGHDDHEDVVVDAHAGSSAVSASLTRTERVIR